MFIYLASPIDQAHERSHSSATTALVGAARVLARCARATVFDPQQAFTTFALGASGFQINEVNSLALGTCDAVFAVVPPGVATLGVPAEIEQALARSKPVVIFTSSDLAAKSVQIQQWKSRGAWVATFVDNALWTEELVRWLRSRVENAAAQQRPTLLYRTETTANLHRAYPDDAGFDLAAESAGRLEGFATGWICTGLRVAIPSGYFGLIVGRSSTFKNMHCKVALGVIDCGWRGELLVGLTNTRPDPVEWVAGQRLAQLVLLPTFPGVAEAVEQLPPHDRGHNGWGSSGQ